MHSTPRSERARDGPSPTWSAITPGCSASPPHSSGPSPVPISSPSIHPPAGDPLDVFAECADAVLAAIEATDPGEHRPNWAGAPTAAFWFRRMAQESAIHRWDAQAAVGAPEPIDPALAVDGVDELVDTFLPSAKRRGITGTGETVHLHATDLDDRADLTGEWMFTFTPEGVEIERTHGKGDMAGRGTASDLLLFVWNRRPVELTCFGEPDLLTWWPANVAI